MRKISVRSLCVYWFLHNVRRKTRADEGRLFTAKILVMTGVMEYVSLFNGLKMAIINKSLWYKRNKTLQARLLLENSLLLL